jgi:helix-hairpin-helix protein
MLDPQPQALLPRRPTPLERLQAGGWYFAVTICSFGFLAAIPYWHAASRLSRRDVCRLALAYTLAGIYLVVLMALTPQRADGSSANETLSTIGGLSAVFVLIAGCVQLRPLRREVYSGRGVVAAHRDPAVARAFQARARREETRRLLAEDPGLRQELGIGRPDLARGYDDGGLIDVNTAPADVIARVCGIDPAHAAAIVADRQARGGTFFNLEEVFVEVPLPPYVADQLRERAII